MAWAALTGPTPYRLVSPGAMSSTMVSSRANDNHHLARKGPGSPGTRHRTYTVSGSG